MTAPLLQRRQPNRSRTSRALLVLLLLLASAVAASRPQANWLTKLAGAAEHGAAAP